MPDSLIILALRCPTPRKLGRPQPPGKPNGCHRGNALRIWAEPVHSPARRNRGKKGMISTSVPAQAGEAHTIQSRRVAQGALFSVIMALSFSHFLNDMM